MDGDQQKNWWVQPRRRICHEARTHQKVKQETQGSVSLVGMIPVDD